MTRKEAIEILRGLKPTNTVSITDAYNTGKALTMAITSLETDEAYQLKYENPTTKNNLGVDCIDRNKAYEIIESWAETFDVGTYFDNEQVKEIIMACANRIDELPSVTPQEPRKGYLSIDDVMSVFDDFMCGEVDEDGTETFLEMLKDKAEVEPQESEG